MKLISELAQGEVRKKYDEIRSIGMRSSIYDVTNRCNLICKGCFYFSSDKNDLEDQIDTERLNEFIESEKSRGVNYAILIGGEPALALDRLDVWYKTINCSAATNGIKRIPRDRYPSMRFGISLWGTGEEEKELRGINAFEKSLKNYEGDNNTYYLYTLTPPSLDKAESIIKRIGDAGLRVHYQLISNDQNVPGYDWDNELLKKVRDLMDEMLIKYPDIVVSSHYYHKVLTTHELMGQKWGYEVCPSVSSDNDTRNPKPKRLINFNAWGADLTTIHRCCTSQTRDCEQCYDGAATMSWVMVNKRGHMNSPEDFANWVDVTYMFAKLYEYVPW